MGPLKLGAKILGSIGKWVLKEGAEKAVKEGTERVVKEGVEKAVKEGSQRGAKEGAEAASANGAGKAAGRAEDVAGRPPTSTNKPEASGPTGANNAAQAIQLQRQLASEAGTAEVMSGGGTAIAGAGTDRTLRDAPRLAAQYGGEPGDWAKVTSEVHKLPDGTTVEVHAYRNATTGQTVEPKSKVGSYSQ